MDDLSFFKSLKNIGLRLKLNFCQYLKWPKHMFAMLYYIHMLRKAASGLMIIKSKCQIKVSSMQSSLDSLYKRKKYTYLSHLQIWLFL